MNAFAFPPFLRAGDRVWVVSPSGAIDQQVLDNGMAKLREWGFQVVCGEHAAASYGNFAGTTDERLADLQAAMNDPEARAIVCSRGGYGAVHLLERLDFTAFQQSPKWLVGYSDISALHSLWQHKGWVSLHAPMLKHLTEEPDDDPCSTALRRILTGEAWTHDNAPAYACPGHPLNRPGVAIGTLRGGNMAVLHGLHGTPFDIEGEDTILFLEDVSENPHAIERMFYQLKLSGTLSRLRGIILGQFTDFVERNQLGKPLLEAVAPLLEACRIPVCYQFPVGHNAQNLPLIEGATVCLEVSQQTVNLRFRTPNHI